MSGAREHPRAGRVGPAERLLQLGVQVGTIRVAHDDRRHRLRPAEVVRLDGLQEFVDISLGEASVIVAVVDIARRRRHHDEFGETARVVDDGQGADHRRHRMADEHHVVQVEFTHDIEHVGRVPGQRRVSFGVPCRGVGGSRPDMVHQHDPEIGFQALDDGPPQLLVAAESMGQQQNGRALDTHCIDVVPGHHTHAVQHRTSRSARLLEHGDRAARDLA